ncbi:radical SAM protein [bacterium]|nr:radical SAM protein [bacterium]
MSSKLLVHEIYLSIQGESTFAGLPCVFVRLTGCDLRCSYCDTAYAFKGGKPMTVEEVIDAIKEMSTPYKGKQLKGQNLPLIELTGGEPLLQKNSPTLMSQLSDAGYTVLIETSGAHPIQNLDPRIRRIMDLKCPSSGESDRMLWENMQHLTYLDEIKCVIATYEDYEWCKAQIEKWELEKRCEILISWCAPLTESQRNPSLNPAPAACDLISRQVLIERMIEDAIPARFQAQLHKIVWPADAMGV